MGFMHKLNIDHKGFYSTSVGLCLVGLCWTCWCNMSEQWRSGVGKVQRGPECRGPRVSGKKLLKIIFPLRWKLEHLDIKH